MGMLSTYLQACQGFVRDRGERYMSLDDLTGYVNRARRELAERTQCLRILTSISGSVFEVEVTEQGSGYTNPVVIVSPPDFPNGAAPFPSGDQARATAIMSGGKILSVSVDYGGAGYFQPTIRITDPTGSGATAVASISPITVTRGNQEVYPFSAVPLDEFPGIESIFAVNSISFLFNNFRYSLPCYPFSIYSAYIRRYPYQYTFIPSACAQLGQGTNGSLYLYPIPSSIYQLELDAFCLPSDLVDDGSFEAIPQPWQDAVPFYATHLSFLELQNLNASKFYLDLYDNLVHRFSAYARPGRISNIYGRF